MGGYAPHTRAGLIALIAMRRMTAEKKRREALAAAKTGEQVEAARDAAKASKKSGWFRR